MSRILAAKEKRGKKSLSKNKEEWKWMNFLRIYAFTFLTIIFEPLLCTRGQVFVTGSTVVSKTQKTLPMQGSQSREIQGIN